jgi:putative ABC transport system substrate-binding protein
MIGRGTWEGAPYAQHEATGVVAWPLAARAQQLDPVRRIGVLFGPEDDPQVKAQLAAFRYGLDRLGWSDGRNVQIDYRFASATKDTTQVLASELIAPQPDVIFVDSTRYTAAVQRQTRTIPIVFNGVADPIGAGFIASLARPGGNLTGLMRNGGAPFRKGQARRGCQGVVRAGGVG